MEVGKTRKMISIAYVIYGLVNLTVFGLSNLSTIHMAFWGILCLTAGVGLWFGRRWSLWLAISLGPILLSLGVTTLYASIMFVGFNPSQYVLLLHVALIVYVAVALVLLLQLILKRRLILESLKQ